MNTEDKFFNQGQLKQMPKKEKMKLEVLEMITKQLNEHKTYTEFEINEILKPIYNDYVLIRRYLVDYQFVQRTNDGSKYTVNTQVKLVPYHVKYMRQIEQYTLTKEDLYYTGHPLNALKQHKENDYPFVLILYRDRLAGVFLLKPKEASKELTHSDFTYGLYMFSIDSTKMGQGIASRALQLIPAYMRQYYPEVEEIVLGVNHKNLRAQHVYLKNGFKDTSRTAEGPLGEMKVLSLKLRGD